MRSLNAWGVRRSVLLGGGGCVATLLGLDLGRTGNDEIGGRGAVVVERTAEAEILGIRRQAVLKIYYV